MIKRKKPVRRRSPVSSRRGGPEALEQVAYTCPTCFENGQVAIDRSAGDRQTFSYDCEVCCRPATITVRSEEGVLIVDVESES